MRKKRTWRYYCEYCGKTGYSAGHMKKHEEHCTLNPNRKCGYCNFVKQTQKPINELLTVLPEPAEFIKDSEEYGIYVFDEEKIFNAVKKLRELTNDCPACILSALRQKGIIVPLVESFDYKKESAQFWEEQNNLRREKEETYYY